MREFKDMLRQIMDEKQLKAVDVCRMTGLGSGAISQYLSGARKPKVETIRQIAYALNVSDTWLLGITDDPVPEDEIVRRGKSDSIIDEMSRRFLKEMTEFYQASDFGVQVKLYEAFKKWQKEN